MKKNISQTYVIAAGLLVFFLLGAGCQQNKNTEQSTLKSDNLEQVQVGVTAERDVCEPGNVSIEGYGDPGKRLKNCFVQYPGEPSRQDGNYYIVEDICGQFTKEFISNIMGKEIALAEPSPIASVHGCSYYFDSSKKDYVMLVLDYLNVEKQKKGREFIGHTIKTESRIPMENFLSYQKDGQLNSTYLVLNPDKYIRIERSNGKALSESEVIDLAIGLGREIKNYK